MPDQTRVPTNERRECTALCDDIERDRDLLLAEVKRLRGGIESLMSQYRRSLPSVVWDLREVLQAEGKRQRVPDTEGEDG